MPAAKNVTAYLNNHYEGMTPEKLIHMLFKGALKHLALAREGVVDNNPKKRGEHLGKVISIISELNTSIDPNMNDESTQFLRGLYASMLSELPKVSINNNLKTLDLAKSYIEKLNQIWETQVLNTPKKQKTVTKPSGSSASYGGGYPPAGDFQPKSIRV